MKEENSIASIEEDTIDIIALLKEFWMARKTILKITLVFTFVGLFVAIFSKNEFTASTTFVPVNQGESIKGNLGGLASLAGINLGGNTSSAEISPELYPQIVHSIPFQKELLETKLTIEGQDSLVTYKEYYKNIYKPGLLGLMKKYTIGLPGLIIGSFKSDKEFILENSKKSTAIISISKEENILIKQLSEQISLTVNSKEGFVSIDVMFPEAKASAELTKRAQELLQEYVMKFKTQKSKEELAYLQNRFLEKEKEYNIAMLNLATFQDQNTSINTALARSQLVDLRGNYNLAFTVYSELAKQLEAQGLQVKKDTPIFTVLKPVTIPNEKSGPKRMMILIVYLFLGVVLSLGYVFWKRYVSDFKKSWALKE
jgi:LPS O-antigen subunit length determinant protein (WzzB/FepE family)